jgi:hypothetical protein
MIGLQHILEVGEAPPIAPAPGQLEVLIVVEEADHDEAQLGVALQLGRKRLGGTCRNRGDGLRRKQGEQEEPADVWQLEQEEDGQRQDGHCHDRPQDREHLGEERPAGARAVEAIHREDCHPTQRIQRQERRGHGDDSPPYHRPIGAPPPDGEHHEQPDREQCVDGHQQRAKARGVTADHGSGSLLGGDTLGQ